MSPPQTSYPPDTKSKISFSRIYIIRSTAGSSASSCHLLGHHVCLTHNLRFRFREFELSGAQLVLVLGRATSSDIIFAWYNISFSRIWVIRVTAGSSASSCHLLRRHILLLQNLRFHFSRIWVIRDTAGSNAPSCHFLGRHVLLIQYFIFREFELPGAQLV